MTSLPRQIFLPMVIVLSGLLGKLTAMGTGSPELNALSVFAIIFGIVWLILGRLVVSFPKVWSDLQNFGKAVEEERSRKD